jgi:hypothetical protein
VWEIEPGAYIKGSARGETTIPVGKLPLPLPSHQGKNSILLGNNFYCSLYFVTVVPIEVFLKY